MKAQSLIAFLVCCSLVNAQTLNVQIDAAPLYERIGEVEELSEDNKVAVDSVVEEVERVRNRVILNEKKISENRLKINELETNSAEHLTRIDKNSNLIQDNTSYIAESLEQVSGEIVNIRALVNSDKYSPLAYGATLDNHEDDDAPEIMRCLREHGICVLPRGRLSLGSPVLVKDGETLIGFGKGISELRVVDNCHRINIASSWFPAIQSYKFPEGHQSTRIEGLSIDLNGDNNKKTVCLKGVNLWGDNHVIRNVEVYGFRPGLNHEAFVIAISRGDNPTIEGNEVHSPASTEGVIYPTNWIPEITCYYIYAENGIATIRNNKAWNVIREGNVNGTHGISVGGNIALANDNVIEDIHVGFWVQMPDHGLYTISNNVVRGEKGVTFHDGPPGYVLDKITITNNTFETSVNSLYMYSRSDSSRSIVKSVLFKNNVCYGENDVFLFINRSNAHERIMIVDNIMGDLVFNTNHGWQEDKFVLKNNMKPDGSSVNYKIRSTNTGSTITEWNE